MPPMTVKALCFDVFGTVTDWRSSVVAEGEALAKKLGVSVPWGEFVNRWRIEGYLMELLKIASGEIDYAPTEELHRRKLADLLPEYGLVGITEEQFEHFNRAWNRLAAWPDVVEGLTMMKQDFCIMTLSNGEYRTMLDLAKHNGLPWDGIISADFFNSVKPDPAVYLGAASMLAMAPQDIMMVACHAADLDAARGVGFRTAYVRRPLEFGPDFPAEETPGFSDYAADDFIALANLLATDKRAGLL